MLALLALLLPVPQDPALEAVLRSESRRVAVTARVAPAVCSVMDMNSAGGGSGVVIDPSGFVLTNFHVVGSPDDKYQLPEPPPVPEDAVARWQQEHAGADEAALAAFKAAWQAEWKEENLPHGTKHWKPMKVGLPDGQLYTAEVLGIDPGSDLAVLKLQARPDGKPWPSVSLGNSDDLLVGETVFAMGNPFLLATDFTPTVTFGIVSGTHRYQEGQGNRMLVYPDCIQVDAAVNPGNSGGPLFNEAGEVVGINGRISVGERGRVNVGVGFAIASNQIENFLGDLLAGRHAEHGTLDMSAWYMTGQNEETKHRGVFVQQTFRDSVAAAAGVRLGDEITRFNGAEVHTANQLATLVGVLPAGAWVSVTHRPMQEFGKGYGEPRTVFLQLASMDTGSSAERKADNQRLASRANRRVATAAVLRPLGTGEEDALCAELSWLTPIGDRVRIQRRGGALRIDVGERVLVLEENGKGFQVQGGSVAELDAEGRARLERELHCNPFLFRGPGRRKQLEGALLEGGVHVHGHPAYRLALPGEGDQEIWYFADGRPAGCTFRDPIRRQRLEFHVCPPGSAPVNDTLLVVADGKLEHRWRMEGPDYRDVPADRFARPRAMNAPAMLSPSRILLALLLGGAALPAQSNDFGKAYSFDERKPRTRVEQTIDKLLPSIVKVHGASGVRTIEAYGTGIVVSKQGHILTLDQVMLQRERTRVVLYDGSVHMAELLPEEPKLGVKLLKIDPKEVEGGLVPVWPERGEGPAFKVGTFVVSLGNCFRLAEFSEKVSATFGVVVGTANTALRYRLADVKYEGDLILTDACNNPGHQGGGLFTLDGRWIGLNLRLLDSKETNTMLSAAIPARDLLPYLDEWVNGKIATPKVVEPKKPVATGIVLFDPPGRTSPPAYVDRVLPDSPGAAIGLRPDDLIVRVDDFSIRTCKELSEVLARHGPGDTVVLTWKRGNQVLNANLELKEARQ